MKIAREGLKVHVHVCTFHDCFRYGLWRVLTGQHKSIEFSTMEVGHTEFHPDWHFGLWKVQHTSQ